MDPQVRAKELLESANASAQQAYWAAAIAAWCAALMLVYGAYRVQTKGLKISEGRVVTGGAATALAVVMILVAVGLAASSVWFLFFRGS
jgi:hypothetical protein